jgi:hypothetical protein
MQSVSVVIIECSEPERLQTAGDGTQHFYCTKHWSRISQKHKLHRTALTQRFGQAQQAPGNRDYLQFTRDAPTVLESNDSGGALC